MTQPNTLTAKLEELLAKATPGPWRVETEAEPEEEQPEVYVVSEQTVCDYTPVATMGRALAISQERKQADAALIAAVKNALPVLLSELTTLRERVAEGEKVVLQTRSLVAGCCDSGFTDDDAVTALFRNNGALTQWLDQGREERG